MTNMNNLRNLLNGLHEITKKHDVNLAVIPEGLRISSGARSIVVDEDVKDILFMFFPVNHPEIFHTDRTELYKLLTLLVEAVQAYNGALYIQGMELYLYHDGVRVGTTDPHRILEKLFPNVACQV